MTILESSLDTSLLAWAKNTVFWKLQAVAEWNESPDYQLFASVGLQGNTVHFAKVRLNPDPAGQVYFYAQEFIDSVMRADLPVANTPHATTSPNSFWVKFSETKNEITTHQTIAFKALKAGLESEDLQEQADWISEKRFLTSIHHTKPTAEGVPEYLYFYQASGSLPLNVKMLFKDYTDESFVATTVSFAGKPMIVPVGYDQLDLGSRLAGKELYAYEVSLGDSEVITYQMTEIFVEKRIFLYANSLGGFDTLLCEGNWKYEAQSKKELVTGKTVQGKWYRAVNSVQSSSGGRTATTWLDAEYLASLEDFMMSREIYELLDNQYVPIVVQGKMSFKEKDSPLQGLAFEYEYLAQKKVFTNKRPVA
jgi:hypothetical protein